MQDTSAESLTLLSRILGPSDKVLLFQDILKLGAEKAAKHHLNTFLQNFPSILPMEEGEEGESLIKTASLASWDYTMPDGSTTVLNLFQEGPFLHVNSDKLQPIRKWVVKRLYEDGNILVNIPVRKHKFFCKKYYKVYEIINMENYKPSLCYS